MTTAQTPLPPPAADALDAAAADAQALARQIAVLGELAEMGLRIGREIERQATEPAPDEARLEAEAAGRAFGRVSRAVRLSLLMQKTLIEARQRGAVTPPTPLEARKADIQTIVGRVIDREVAWNRPGARAELERQTTDRLDRDFAGDLLARPVSELIDLICKDLGLHLDWPRLADEAWAVEEVAGGGAVGWPLAAMQPAPRRVERPRPEDPPDTADPPDDDYEDEDDPRSP